LTGDFTIPLPLIYVSAVPKKTGTAFAITTFWKKAKEGNMECFFYGTTREGEERKRFNGVVSFAVPDLGIIFRAQFKGSPAECEYASLLALLEFVEQNPNLFKNKRIEIYGDSFLVVHQVNMQMHCAKDLEPYRNMALGYKKKIQYVLNWIPKGDNPATI
jgi:hypothetical protein